MHLPLPRRCALNPARHRLRSGAHVSRGSRALTNQVAAMSGRPLIASARAAGGRDGPWSCFRLCVALSEGGFSSVGHLDPLPVRRGLGVIVVVPVPPLIRRGLGVTLWRVLPGLLTSERRYVEVAPGAPHRLVAAGVDEVCAEHPL